MQLNEVQQAFYEKLKLLMVSHSAESSIAKAKEIFNTTLASAQSVNEQSFLNESLTPILQEFIRYLSEEIENTPAEQTNDAGNLIQEDGSIENNANLAGFVNVRDERGNIIREQVDLDDELTTIGNAVGNAMKNFNKTFKGEYHDDDDMDPEIAEYLRTHGRG